MIGKKKKKLWDLKLTLKRLALLLQSNNSARRRSILLLSLTVVLLLLHVGTISTTNGSSLPLFSSGGIVDLRSVGYQARPRTFSYVVDRSGRVLRSRALDTHPYRYPSKRKPDAYDDQGTETAHKSSDDYSHGLRDPFAVNGCAPQYEWQTTSFPTCNTLHEVDLSPWSVVGTTTTGATVITLLNNGYWRDVWTATTPHDVAVLKTMRYEHEYVDRNYDRHRRDAVAAEHLTSSPHVVDIYGFCGNAGVFEYAAGGDLDGHLWPKDRQQRTRLTPVQRLTTAVHVARGIVDAHHADDVERASLAHTDITPGQFVLVDGIFKLNDFNRCRFLRWDEMRDRPCGYRVGSNPGKFRSPEEYKYLVQDEKVDVYSMGNIFYALLTERWPFKDLSDKQVKKKVAAGERPEIPKDLRSSDDAVVKTFLKAINMCWTQDPSKRASAWEVEQFLTGMLEKMSKDKGNEE